MANQECHGRPIEIKKPPQFVAPLISHRDQNLDRRRVKKKPAID
jgi:hypothetical protein